MLIDPKERPVAIATLGGERRIGWADPNGEVYLFDGKRVTVEQLLAVGAKFYTREDVQAAMLEWEKR